MTHLGSAWKEWEACVAASPECLMSSDSPKNVHHVLSKAVSRGPQKLLFSKAKPHFATMVQNEAGQKILKSIVEFGTTKSVSGIAQFMIGCDQVVGSTKCLQVGTGAILKAIFDREDDSSADRQSLQERLQNMDFAPAIESDAWLVAFMGALPADDKLMTKLVKCKSAEKALGVSLSAPKRNKFALQFVETVLKTLFTKSPEGCASFSRFVLSSVAPQFKHNAAFHPREEVLLALADYGDVATVNSIATSITQWTKVAELSKHEFSSKVLFSLLSRSGQSQGEALLRKAVPDEISAQQLATSRKSAMLKLITLAKSRYPTVVDSISKDRSHLLNAAAVKLSASTMPRGLSIRETIARKIAALDVNAPSNATRMAVLTEQVGSKRKRA